MTPESKGETGGALDAGDPEHYANLLYRGDALLRSLEPEFEQALDEVSTPEDRRATVLVVMSEKKWRSLADSMADIEEVVGHMTDDQVMAFFPIWQLAGWIMEGIADSGMRKHGWFTEMEEGD